MTSAVQGHPAVVIVARASPAVARRPTEPSGSEHQVRIGGDDTKALPKPVSQVSDPVGGAADVLNIDEAARNSISGTVKSIPFHFSIPSRIHSTPFQLNPCPPFLSIPSTLPFLLVYSSLLIRPFISTSVIGGGIGIGGGKSPPFDPRSPSCFGESQRVRVTNRTLVREFSPLGGVVGALGASPAALADPAIVTAADRAGISAGVQAATSAICSPIPDVNEFMTGLAGQPGGRGAAVVGLPGTQTPQIKAEVQSIRQPLADMRERCGPPLLNQE